MTAIKTSDLAGAALDWAVAQCEGEPIRFDPMAIGADSIGPQYWIWDERRGVGAYRFLRIGGTYNPSRNWTLAGPIIERECIVFLDSSSVDFWDARYTKTSSACPVNMRGPTPLVASMRCYVGAKLGDVVDVPLGLFGVCQEGGRRR